MPREPWNLGTVLGALIILAVALYVLSVLRRAFKGSVLGQRQSGPFVTVYEWEHALLYIDGRFSQILPPGRHFTFGWRRRDVFTLRRNDHFFATAPLDVTSMDKLVFRLVAAVVYTITDPQEAFEAHDRDVHIRLAVMSALTRLAAEHTLDAFLTDRAALDEKLLSLVPSPVAGCAIKTLTITAVTLPPEIRRLFTEVERAKLEGLATLERARGEHAALRSLANAARMLKGNPELMNLRVLQALAAANGKRPPTLVLGQGSLLPIGSEAASSDE
jgi:regulator of protease activity HflC (stomatin/prohibitin superfamily)